MAHTNYYQQRHHQSVAQDLPTSITHDFEGADDGNGIDFGGADDGNSIDFRGANDRNGVEDSSEDGKSIEGSEDKNDTKDFEPEGAKSNDLEDTSAPSVSTKRTHVRAESDSHSSTVSPPCKKAGPLMCIGSDELCLPGRDYLRLALKYEGSMNLDVSNKGE
jgi:hypothetical protein